MGNPSRGPGMRRSPLRTVTCCRSKNSKIGTACFRVIPQCSRISLIRTAGARENRRPDLFATPREPHDRWRVPATGDPNRPSSTATCTSGSKSRNVQPFRSANSLSVGGVRPGLDAFGQQNVEQSPLPMRKLCPGRPSDAISASKQFAPSGQFIEHGVQHGRAGVVDPSPTARGRWGLAMRAAVERLPPEH